MNNKPDYNNAAVFKKSLGTLEDLLAKLFKFLKERTPVSIKHADYIPCYELYFANDFSLIVIALLFTLLHRLTLFQRNFTIISNKKQQTMPRISFYFYLFFLRTLW